MTNSLGIWLLPLLPSTPLLCIYFAFRTVLGSKKFEMRMLLTRGESLTKYLSAYGRRQPNSDLTLANDTDRDAYIASIVDGIFRLHFSNKEYIVGIAFNVLVTGLLTALAMFHAGVSTGLSPTLFAHISTSPEVTNIIAGGVGALLWRIYELAERYRTGNLAPDSIFTMGARMLLIGAVGALIGAFVKEGVAWPVAFGVGVLPIATIRSFVLDRTLKSLKVSAADPIHENPPFSCLQGWNQDVSEKLLRAGISSVEQLACTNPFFIFLRANLDWRVILDLCDQALLIVYIGEKAESLRPLGFRSAVELAELAWSNDENDLGSNFGNYILDTLVDLTYY